MAIELRVGLPSVDEPRFDLQLVGWEPLHAHAVKEPGRIGRHIRGLIGPIIVIVVTEETDVRHEDSCVDIESVLHVEVIPAVGFGYILVSILEIPLADSAGSSVTRAGCRACVVARRGGGEQSLHEQDSATNVLPMEVAADAGLLDLDFAGPEALRRPDDRMVTRLIEIRHVVS